MNEVVSHQFSVLRQRLGSGSLLVTDH